MEKTRQSVASIADLASTDDLSLVEEIYAAVLRINGRDYQSDMAIEECAELISAVIHHRRHRVTDDKVAEEVADVMIMMEQMRIMVGAERVDRWRDVKLMRLRARFLDGDGTSKI